jgi:hypothetical protein
MPIYIIQPRDADGPELFLLLTPDETSLEEVVLKLPDTCLGTPGTEIMLDGMTGFLEQIAVGCPDDAEAFDECVSYISCKRIL